MEAQSEVSAQSPSFPEPEQETQTPELQKFAPFAKFISNVLTVAISEDGRIIAVGLADGTIEIWDLLLRKKRVRFSAHESSVRSVAMTRDGQTIVSGGADEKVRLWDRQGQPIGNIFTGHGGYVFSVAISKDGQTIVSGGEDGTVRLWNRQGEPISDPWNENAGVVRSVAISADGETIVSSRQAAVKSVTISQDGQTIVSGDSNGTVRLWNREGKAIANPLNGHQAGIKSVTISQDGQTILSSGEDGTVRLWNREGKPLGKSFFVYSGYVNSASVSPDDSTIVTGSDDGTVRLWDVSDPQRKRHIEIGKHQQGVCAVVFDPQGDYIFSASKDGIKAWRWPEFNITRVPQAFRNDQATGEDSLDVAKELESLADVLMLRSLEPPLAVAILGNWGSGKSFGMHLIEKQITKIRCQQLTKKQTWGDKGDESYLSPYVGHVYQIKFNAWSYAKSDLWASLMQTIFEQLDRQLTLEQQLRTNGNVNDLAGGEIWGVLNQMSDSDRKAILESQLSEEIFANLNAENADSHALWSILGEVRKKEKEKLEITEKELQKLEQEVKDENENIEKEVNQKFENKSIVTVFLTQFKELSKNDFGDSIFKDFLNHYGFESKEELEAQIPIFQELDKLSESQMIEKLEDLIQNKDSSIKDFIKKSAKVKSFVEEQPSRITNLLDFIQKDKTILTKIIFIISLPFIIYIIIFSFSALLLQLKEITSALTILFTTLLTTLTPIGSSAIEIFKKFRTFQTQTSRVFKAAQESVEQEKQKLATEKDQKIQDEIKSKNSEKQEDIEKLKAQVERQKQCIGLTAQYTSLLDFVNNRLEENSYQKLLGIMNQVQRDLSDLSDHLTYILGKTNPEKLAVLKKYFPRGPVRIVLYIDDLDRCPPDKVVQVLESVQLLLNTNIFIIVLAIDDCYIGRALEQTYRGVLKRGGTPSGVDYIEKIIQLPYRMRPISKDVAESYLKSLVDIDEDIKQENPNISSSQPVIQKSIVLEQTTEHDESKILPKDGSRFLLEDQIEEYFVETEEKITEDDISQPQNKESNSESNNKKIQHSTNSDPLVSFERFTAEEFQWIKECCQHVDLTPRTAKRLINICKIIKIIWTPTANDTTWKVEPSPECKQTLIAFLALAGRYPKEMRKLLEEIYLEFEETDKNTVIIEKDKWLNRLQNLDVFMDRHNQREWKKFKINFMKMPPQTEFVFEKRTFNLATSFCFVGDIGYDPDDNYNREYRFEDRKKEYGFQKN